jgi:hypothetical protein
MNSNETWSRLGEYIEAMADLAAGSVKDLSNELMGMWNSDSEKGAADTALDTVRESIGIGVKASAKAWVTTRQLLLDLAE